MQKCQHHRINRCDHHLHKYHLFLRSVIIIIRSRGLTLLIDGTLYKDRYVIKSTTCCLIYIDLPCGVLNNSIFTIFMLGACPGKFSR